MRKLITLLMVATATFAYGQKHDVRTDARIAGELEVIDSVKTRTGYYSWDGSDWVEANGQMILHSSVTSVATTGTSWETLGSYSVPGNTLSANGQILEVRMAMIDAEAADSLLVLFGADTTYFARSPAGILDVGVVRTSAGNQLFLPEVKGGTFRTGTEDETGSVTITLKAKSVTTGNNVLRYWRVAYLKD